MSRARAIAFIIAAAILIVAPSAGAVDVRPGFNGTVETISAPDANGTRYVGGGFTAWNSYDTGNFAAADATTAAIAASFPRISGQVYTIVPDGLGYVYVGGIFNCVGPNSSGLCDGVDDVPVQGLARFTTAGALDTSWRPSANGNVFSIAISGSSVYVGGDFSAVRAAVGGTDVPRNAAAAFDRNTGSAVLAWNPGLATSEVVNALAPSTVGVVVGTRKMSDAALLLTHATTGARTAWQPNLDAAVRDVAVTTVGGVESLFVVGDFTCLGGATGDIDSDCTDAGESRRLHGAAFSLATTPPSLLAWDPAPENMVYAIAINSDAAWIVGEFACLKATTNLSCAGGGVVTRMRGAEVSLTGSGTVGAWTPSLNMAARDIAVSSGVAYIVGHFTTAVDVASVHPRPGIVSYDIAANEVRAWNPSPSQTPGHNPITIAISGTRVFFGGDFSYAGGTPRLHSAALNSDGALGTWHVPFDAAVHDIEVVGEHVYVGGDFGYAGSSPRFNLAKASTAGTGTVASGFTGYVGGSVQDVAVAGGIVYVVGSFTSAYGSTRNYAFAVNTDGTTLQAWHPDLNDVAMAVEVAADGTAYIGGFFTQAKSTSSAVTRRGAMAIGTSGSGTVGSWSPMVSAPPGSARVLALTLHEDVVYIGGTFTCVGSIAIDADCTDAGEATRGYGAAFSTAGAALAWDPVLNGDLAVLERAGERVFLGGYFSTSRFQIADHLAAVDATSGIAATWGVSNNGGVEALEASGDYVYFGGGFTDINNTPQMGIDRLASPDRHVLTLTLNGSGRIASSPGTLDCTASCAAVFFRTPTTTLTATPASGQRLASWGGACAGETAATCTVAMTAARAVTATFEAVSSTPTNGAGAGSSSAALAGSGVSASGPQVTILSAKLLRGTQIRITATVGAPGLATATGTISGATACRATTKAKKAGRITLTCRLSPKARRLVKGSPQTVRIVVSLNSTSGAGSATTDVRTRR